MREIIAVRDGTGWSPENSHMTTARSATSGIHMAIP
jgi:hypothetical protein